MTTTLYAANPRLLRHGRFRVRCHQAFSTAPNGKSLRILYCGSDDFSAVALRKLHEERVRNHTLVETLDVVCKAGKPSGRGLKRLREVPIKGIAQELDLPLHEISTFTGWKPPASTNLIIAVSFGLKVPPRILNGAEFGGLNLHPSLLPDLRGPAPLHHALLEGRTTTGVTLQTLHPEHFDQGAILAQRPFIIAEGGKCSFDELYGHSAEIAADLLIDSLRNRSYLHPQAQPSVSGQVLTHARKVTPNDAHVDWDTWPAERILRVQRALGGVWSNYSPAEGKTVRVQWHGLRLIEVPPQAALTAICGEPFLLDSAALATQTPEPPVEGLLVLIPTCDGNFLTCKTVTIEGRPKHEAATRGVELLLAERVK